MTRATIHPDAGRVLDADAAHPSPLRLTNDEAGVANVPQVEPLAVFDPREVVGVQVSALDVEAWKVGA